MPRPQHLPEERRDSLTLRVEESTTRALAWGPEGAAREKPSGSRLWGRGPDGPLGQAREGPWVPVLEEMWKAGPLTLTCKLTEPSWLHSSLGRSVLGRILH